MSVKPETLDNQERGMDLSSREGKSPKKGEEAAVDLQDLRARIAAAVIPKDTVSVCGDCFRRGWVATLSEIEDSPANPDSVSELRAMRGRIAAVKARTPKDRAPHEGESYRRGWAAAVAAMDGGPGVS